MTKEKTCALLKKYYVPHNEDSLSKWQKDICVSYCPLDVCIYDRFGQGVHPTDKQRLESTSILCPKCKTNGLRMEYDGWECIYCSFTIYKPEKAKKP